MFCNKIWKISAKKFAKTHWKAPAPEPLYFIKKEVLVQVFSSEFFEISKNIFSYRTPPVTASVSGRLLNLPYLLASVTASKVSVFRGFLVRIFPHSDWIRRDTKHVYMFFFKQLKFLVLGCNLVFVSLIEGYVFSLNANNVLIAVWLLS